MTVLTRDITLEKETIDQISRVTWIFSFSRILHCVN